MKESPEGRQVDVGGGGQDELLELLLVVVGSPPTLDLHDPLRLLLEDFDAPDLTKAKKSNEVESAVGGGTDPGLEPAPFSFTEEVLSCMPMLVTPSSMLGRNAS